MEFHLPITIPNLPQPIGYKDSILLMGSCFTEHIGDRLQEMKFNVLQNPNGILFDPVSVCNSLVSYIENKQYQQSDFFYLNELWQSWNHHSRFSDTNSEAVLENINGEQQKAHHFLKNAEWLIITLGSSFNYILKENNQSVANCHRAPGQLFNKHLLGIDETITALDNMMHRIIRFNPKLKIIFTISPVRHVRDGVIENNRSKARLLEAVHHMVHKFDKLFYFPAYELVIDVLRDYRFYDSDLVHPNYAATDFVFEKFVQHYIGSEEKLWMKDIKQVVIASKHKPFQPNTNAHRLFLAAHLEKTKTLKKQFPYLDWDKEIGYFEKELNAS